MCNTGLFTRSWKEQWLPNAWTTLQKVPQMSESGGEGALKPFEPDHGWRKFGTVYEFPVDAVTNYWNFFFWGGDLKITHIQSLPTLGANSTGLL